MTRDIFNKLIDELDASSKNVLKNKNALYGKKDDPLSFRRIKNDEN